MAISFQNSPLNFHKFKKNPKNLNLEKSKKIDPQNQKSFWAFLSSIFIYISIFYAFNLSPSTLFSTTKFWFFISNTLVIIIAADYISFSSSKNHDYYDEYVDKSSKITSLPPFDDKILAKKNIEEDKPTEKVINVVEDPDPNPNPEEGSGKKEEDKPIEKVINVVEDPDPDPEEGSGEKGEEITVRKFGRSYSDVAAAAAVERVVVQRTLSEKHDENEFSRMSDEELNGRVEEFIRRFNRQIRLQAVNSSTN